MQVQLVCRSDKDPAVKYQLEEPFPLEEAGGWGIPSTILVPTLSDYHAVLGNLVLLNVTNVEVICLLTPSTYSPPVGKVPYALVTNTHSAHADPEGMRLTYYFKLIPEVKNA